MHRFNCLYSHWPFPIFTSLAIECTLEGSLSILKWELKWNGYCPCRIQLATNDIVDLLIIISSHKSHTHKYVFITSNSPDVYYFFFPLIALLNIRMRASRKWAYLLPQKIQYRSLQSLGIQYEYFANTMTGFSDKILPTPPTKEFFLFLT